MNTDTTPTTTAIVSPVLALLRSRKFIVLIGTAIVDILIAFVPALVPVRQQLITVLSALAGALILAISHEDASKPAPGTTTSTISVDAQTVSTPVNIAPATDTIPPYTGNQIHG